MLLDDKQKEVSLVKNIINTSVLLSKQLKLYGASNPQIDLATGRLLTFLETYFLYHETLTMTVARHGFLYEDDFIDRNNKAFISLAYMFFQHGISSITIQKNPPSNHIQQLLILAARPPSETWEEGGMVTALQLRGVDTIIVREMSEDDIEFNDDIEILDRSVLLKEKSPLWDRFAQAVHLGLTAKTDKDVAEDDATSPGTLAEMTSEILGKMSLASQNKFSKGLSNFLASLQFEKVKRYRNRALVKLTEFISRVSPSIRKRLFANIFSLNLKPDFTEDFFSGLSDEVIIELLESSAQDSEYAPPLIMKVLSKIAQDKKLNIEQAGQLDNKITEKKREIEKLFKKDDFEKYVPDEYRNALLNIIQHDVMPQGTSEELLKLKGTLEDARQEKHVADIILKILNESPDQNQLKGLGENLINIVYVYLEEGSYKELRDLCLLINQQDGEEESFVRFKQLITTSDFATKVLAGVNKFGHSKFDEIESLTLTIGDSFVAPLLDFLATEAHRTHRLFYLKLLQQLDSKVVIEHAVTHLKDSRWFFVRNIIYVLRNIQDKDAMPYVKPLSGHPHPKVKSEALRTCLHYDCPDSIEQLLLMLRAKDVDTVDTAISLSLMTKKAPIVKELVEMLYNNPVINYRLEQKKAIVKTLAKVAPKGSLPVFFELLSMKNTLHPRQHKQLMEEILKVFSSYDSSLLLPVLKENLPSFKGDLRSRLTAIQSRVEA